MAAVKVDGKRVKALRKEIGNLQVDSKLDIHKEFLPEDQFSKLVNEDEVKLILPGASRSLIDAICQDLRRVFLIIVMRRKDYDNLGTLMESCKESGMTDGHLPIDNIAARNGTCQLFNKSPEGPCTHDKVLNFFHDDWEQSEVKDFFRDQWTFQSPVFDHNLQPKLDTDCILPFVWVSGIKEGGHFSEVREAIVHPDHCLGGWASTTMTNEYGENIKGIRVASKKLLHLSEGGYKVETAWEREASALNQISRLRHKHLIRLVAAFRRGTEHFIMLEWADGGNLRKFWERSDTTGMDLDGDRIMDALEQLSGLAGALSKLHKTNNNTQTARIVSSSRNALATRTKLESNRKPKAVDDPVPQDANSLRVPEIRLQPDTSDDGYYTSDDVSKQDKDENWRHGDLKPDNILRFKKKGSNKLGTLKIGDLGLAKQHLLATSLRVEATQQKYSTLQYEAPEAITNLGSKKPRSRRYDIWSMGCIILEYVIWLLYGWEGLRNFYDEQMHIDQSTETLYFLADKTTGTAEVSNYAKSWIEYILQNDPECNNPSGSALGDLVRFVRERLLVVALPEEGMTEEDFEQCRATAGDLETALSRIWRKARNDEAVGGRYLFSASDRTGIKPPQLRKRRRGGGDLLSTKADRKRPSGGSTKNLVQ
jgi:serine/threonine protein kinase